MTTLTETPLAPLQVTRLAMALRSCGLGADTARAQKQDTDVWEPVALLMEARIPAPRTEVLP